MKEPYEKPEVYTDDVSVAFAQACCSKGSPIGLVPGMAPTQLFCKAGCHYEQNLYSA
jgi:hypothetical protein